MNFRKLGSSDIEVSEISLGSWLTYSGGVEREQARGVREGGVRRGHQLHRHRQRLRARRRPRRCLARCSPGYERSSYVLATKVYFAMSATDRGLSAAQIHKQIDASLERLQTDYVDLYQCHRYDEDTPLEETMTALTEVVQAGKARHIGFSEWPVERIDESLALAGRRALGLEPAAVLDAVAHARGRGDPAVRRSEQISQIVWSPLGQGVLTGKYLPGQPPPPDSRAASDEHERLHRPADRAARARGGPAPAARRRAGRPDDGAARARLGPAPAECRLGDRRRQPPRAGARQRLRLGHRARARTPSPRSTGRSATSSCADAGQPERSLGLDGGDVDAGS